MLYDALYEGATILPMLVTMIPAYKNTDDAIGPLNPLTTWAGAEFGGAKMELSLG